MVIIPGLECRCYYLTGPYHLHDTRSYGSSNLPPNRHTYDYGFQYCHDPAHGRDHDHDAAHGRDHGFQYCHDPAHGQDHDHNHGSGILAAVTAILNPV